MRDETDDLVQVATVLSETDVGFVKCLDHGESDRGHWATLPSMAID